MTVENCGFDLNGGTSNALAALVVTGNTQPVQYITVRGNILFDSTMPGTFLADYPEHQRQYIALTNIADVLIEHNTLSEGGRIKAGRPGVRMVIRHNTLHNINDNGITVVGQGNHNDSDILVEHNTILNPLSSGILFGMDGQAQGTLATTLSDITVHHNLIIGDWTAGCITGVLPNATNRISIADNACQKTGATGPFAAGISLGRSTVAEVRATQVTMERNVVRADVFNALNGGAGIFVKMLMDNVCVLDNTLTDTATAIRFDLQLNAKVTGNTLGGGIVRVTDPGSIYR